MRNPCYSKLPRVKRTHIAALFILLIASTSASSARGEEFFDPRFKVHLQYPERFELANQEQALLVLRAAKGGFPTFNIIVQSGDYDAAAPLSAQEKEVLRSYGQVGLVDVKSEGSRTLTVAGRSAFQTRLRYGKPGEELYSIVTIVPGPNKHFILTYIAPIASDPARAEEDLSILLGSFSAPAPEGAAPPHEQGSRLYLLLGVAALAAAAGLTFFRLRASLRKSKPR